MSERARVATRRDHQADALAQVIWDLPCAGCGCKPPAPGCDGLCDDCFIEVLLLESLCDAPGREPDEDADLAA